MSGVVPPRLEDFEAAQTIMRNEALRSETVDLVNVEAVLALGAYQVFTFRQRGYRVPPVPMEQGLRMRKLALVYKQASENQKIEIMLEVARSIMKMFHDLVEPMEPLQRWTWRWRNPFLKASEGEVGQLLRFFSMCQTSSSINTFGVIDTAPTSSSKMRSRN